MHEHEATTRHLLAAAEELPTAETNIQHCCTKWHEVFFALAHACPRGQGTSVTKGPPCFSSLVVLWLGWLARLARLAGRQAHVAVKLGAQPRATVWLMTPARLLGFSGFAAL